jgi:TolB-like protein
MVSDDEEATVNSIRGHFNTLFVPTVEKNKGRIIKTMGDGVLIEFSSVISAVECGVEIQEAMRGRNTNLPAARRIEFRAGINLGDVMLDGDDVLGDGVNVAARLQAIADPGSVFISRAVYEQVNGKLDMPYEFMGERMLKNIPTPVAVYRIWPPGDVGAAPRTRRRTSLALPSKPSIAVMPLTNMTGDETLEYFCDGMTEEIIADLCRFKELFVIAQHSSFAFKDKAITITEVANELGVRYVLEGSVIRANDKTRITAQLIDAATSYHIWADRYEFEAAEVPRAHDEITRMIVAALPIRLEEAEKTRMRSVVEPSDLESYGYLLRGLESYREFTKQGHMKAREYFEKAIECDPNFARAYAALSRVYNHEHRFNWTPTPEKSLRKALELAHKAVFLDPSDARGYSELGTVHLFMKNVGLAIAHFEKALALNSNDPDIMASQAEAHVYNGEPQKSLDLLEVAMRLNPFPPDEYLWKLADAYYGLRDYEAVVQTIQKMHNPSEGDRLAAASYAHLGQFDKARYHAAAVLRKHPEFTISAWVRNQPDTDRAEVEHLSEGLRRAGLPE